MQTRAEILEGATQPFREETEPWNSLGSECFPVESSPHTFSHLSSMYLHTKPLFSCRNSGGFLVLADNQACRDDSYFFLTICIPCWWTQRNRAVRGFVLPGPQVFLRQRPTDHCLNHLHPARQCGRCAVCRKNRAAGRGWGGKEEVQETKKRDEKNS